MASDEDGDCAEAALQPAIIATAKAHLRMFFTEAAWLRSRRM
jgi:hypothetical protein